MPLPTINCPASPSKTGAYQISWMGPQGSRFCLKENDHIVYQGPHLASTLTGRQAGTYTYSIGLTDSNGCNQLKSSCVVTVSPPSMLLSFTLFGLGMMVFLATLILIIGGHIKHKQGKLQ